MKTTYKDFIKETDENGVLEYWIEQPIFKPSDFKEAIAKNYTHRLKSVTKNELSIENEIEFIKEELTDLQGLIKAKPSYDYEKLSFAQRISGDCWFSDETLKEFKRYFEEYYNYKIKGFKADYLKNKLKDLQEPKATTPDEPKNQPQYAHIFKDNSFEVWQRMFDEFKITKSSRTDIDFMFQIMKYDELIHSNIGLTDIQNWINEVYEIPFDKIKYTDPKQKSNEKRMIAYNLINPK